MPVVMFRTGNRLLGAPTTIITRLAATMHPSRRSTTTGTTRGTAPSMSRTRDRSTTTPNRATAPANTIIVHQPLIGYLARAQCTAPRLNTQESRFHARVRYTAPRLSTQASRFHALARCSVPPPAPPASRLAARAQDNAVLANLYNKGHTASMPLHPLKNTSYSQ